MDVVGAIRTLAGSRNWIGDKGCEADDVPRFRPLRGRQHP